MLKTKSSEQVKVIWSFLGPLCATALITIASSSSADSGEKVFRYSEDESPSQFDPVGTGDTYANLVVSNVYDTLYEYKYLKEPYELKPRLAEGWPSVSKDGLSYTFKIKKGVRFADDSCFPNGRGREVLAKDFIYSIARHFDAKTKSQGAWLWQDRLVGVDEWKKAGSSYDVEIKGLRAIDSHTIKIDLRIPYPQIIYTFEMGFSAVVPRECVEKYGREFALHPVGSGPFTLVSHSKTKTVLAKNKNYRDERFSLEEEGYDSKVHGQTGIAQLDGKQVPIVDKVEISWIPDIAARWNSFTKGNEINWTVLQNEQMKEVLASTNPIKLTASFSEKYHSRFGTEAATLFNLFNMDDPDFGYHPDKAVNEKHRQLRCAVRKASDWQIKINRFYLGLGKPFPGVIPPAVDGFDPSLDRDSVIFDLKKAKTMLDGAGYSSSNLPAFTYSGPASVRHTQFFELFRGEMVALGFPRNQIKNKTYANFGDYSRAFRDRQVQYISYAWTLDYPDAENVLALFYSKNSSPGSNASNYSNPEFDRLYDRARILPASPERTELYKQLNKIVVDDCVAVGSYSRTRVFLWHKNAIIWPQRDFVRSYFRYLDIK